MGREPEYLRADIVAVRRAIPVLNPIRALISFLTLLNYYFLLNV